MGQNGSRQKPVDKTADTYPKIGENFIHKKTQIQHWKLKEILI